MTPRPPLEPDQAHLQALAARVLVRTTWLAAGLLLASAIASEAAGDVTRFSRLRGAFGLLLLAAAVLGQWPLSRQPRLASAVVLGCAAAGAWAHAWISGVGLHAMVLMAALFVVMLSGLLCSALTAVAFAAVNMLAALATFVAERDGVLQGLTAALELKPTERLLGMLLLTTVALLCALLLVRVLKASLGRVAEQEQRLAQLVRIGSDWTWEMDEHGLMTYISPSFEARTGRTVAEFLQTQRPGGPVIVDDESYQRLLQHMRRHEPWRDCIITVRCADGTELVVNGSGEPVTDGRGRFAGWRGASRNVTAEIRTQRLLDRLVTFSPDPICVLRDRDGVIQRVNPAFVQRVGLPADQIIGRTHRELDLWNDPPAEARLRADLRHHGVVRDLRFDWRPRDQPARPTLLSAVRFESGGELVVVATTRDIAEVERARAEAEAANRAKSAFLATMSHEIRTPLNGVLGLAHLMQDPTLDPARRNDYLTHLVQAAEQLSGIVSDVLDLSKIEAGHLQIDAVGFALPALARDAFATFEALGRERGLALSCEIAPDVPERVLGDPVRLRQILANYLGNALKFTVRGEVRLCVRSHGGWVRFEVHDTGPGVSAPVREQLFKPFSQGDASTTRRFGGTGLGLSICRELAVRMGGSVGADSDGSSGSCFWVELPLPVQAAADAAPPGEAPATPLLGLRVLVAEDNAVNMLIVGTLLRRLGAEVLEAGDGEEAVSLAEARNPAVHVVLMDLHMPVLDGLAATRRLRVGPLGWSLPIFALSAAVLDQERQDAADAGMNGFIPKPVMEDELLRVLAPLVPRP